MSLPVNESKVVSLEEAKKRRGNRKASTPPQQKAQRATPSEGSSSWGRKIFHVVQVVLFLIILSLFVKLCHGGSI